MAAQFSHPVLVEHARGGDPKTLADLGDEVFPGHLSRASLVAPGFHDSASGRQIEARAIAFFQGVEKVHEGESRPAQCDRGTRPAGLVQRGEKALDLELPLQDVEPARRVAKNLDRALEHVGK